MSIKKTIIKQREILKKVRKIVPLRADKVIESKNTYNRKNKDWKKEIHNMVKCAK